MTGGGSTLGGSVDEPVVIVTRAEWDTLNAKVRRLPGLDEECMAYQLRVVQLEAALDEAFDFDHLPIPIVVNYLVDAWNDEDGYDPGDPTEVTAALLAAIAQAATPAGGNDVLDLPRAGEADRG